MKKSEHETRDKEKPKHRTQQDIEKRTWIKTKNQIQEQTETRVMTEKPKTRYKNKQKQESWHADIELQIVLCAPASEIIDFLPIGTLIFVHNAADDDRVRRLTCDVWEHSHGCRVWTGPGWANSPAGLKCCAIRLRRCDGQSVLSGSRLILEWHQWWSHYCVDCRPLACHPAAVLLCSFQAPLPKISNQST